MNIYTEKYKNFDEFCKNITTIDELLKWYKTNKIKWPDRIPNKSANDRPMSWPDRLIRTKIGLCFDHGIFMHYFCERNNIDHSVLFIQNFLEIEREYYAIGHVIGIYKSDNGYNFFDIAGNSVFSKELGPYRSINDAIKHFLELYSNSIYNSHAFNSHLYNVGKKTFWYNMNPVELKVFDRFYNNYKISQDDIAEQTIDVKLSQKYGMEYPANKKINRGWFDKMNHDIKKWISDNIGKPLFLLGLPSNETGLMGTTGTAIAGVYGHPFVMQVMDPTFVRPKYAIANDLVTDKICTPNEDDTLKLMNSDDYLKGKKVRIFKYKGTDGKQKIQKILESLDKPVTREFIYESLSGKEMMTDDQIYLDEDFEEVDFSTLRHIVENEAYSVLNKYIQSNPTLASKFNVVNTQEASFKLKDHPDSVVIMENSSLGYFACNKNTLRRTKYYSNINDIEIGSDIDG